MIVGLVSDAHGNASGLERCLDALRNLGARRIYFLGDAVGYFPEENAVFRLLRSRDAVCIRGNHEAMLLGELPIPEDRAPAYKLSEARSRIDAEHLDWIRAWPERLELDGDGRRVLLVHGSPADPLQGYVYPDSDLSPLAGEPFDLIAMGHTHRPFLGAAGAVRVINVGSSGMPRDVGNLASCALYDTDSGAAEILRVDFNAIWLALRWAERADPAAVSCLLRPASGAIVGKLVSL